VLFLPNRHITEKYYWDGFEYRDIILFLQQYRGIVISMRTLLHRLASFGLRWRGQPSSLTQIWQAVNLELTEPGLFGTDIIYQFISLQAGDRWVPTDSIGISVTCLTINNCTGIHLVWHYCAVLISVSGIPWLLVLLITSDMWYFFDQGQKSCSSMSTMDNFASSYKHNWP